MGYTHQQRLTIPPALSQQFLHKATEPNKTALPEIKTQDRGIQYM